MGVELIWLIGIWLGKEAHGSWLFWAAAHLAPVANQAAWDLLACYMAWWLVRMARSLGGAGRLASRLEGLTKLKQEL
ncbi:hypothetical protein VNO77_41579 [Canavalia gladiata]|uniref:Uncharacterized protein n=1 Tax=Canavalia gladiata TaxID=3824 RepID=A0AAN9K2M8_CANGL